MHMHLCTRTRAHAPAHMHPCIRTQAAELGLTEAEAESKKDIAATWERDAPPKLLLQEEQGSESIEAVMFSLRRVDETHVEVVKLRGKCNEFMYINAKKPGAKKLMKMRVGSAQPAHTQKGMNVISVPGHHVCDVGLASNNNHEMCRGKLLVRMKPVSAEVDQIRRVIEESEEKRVSRAHSCIFYATYSAIRGRPAWCTPVAGCWQRSGTCNPLTQATELPRAAIEMHAEATQGQDTTAGGTTIGRARNPVAPPLPVPAPTAKAASPARLRRCTECNVPVRREVDKQWTLEELCETCAEDKVATHACTCTQAHAPMHMHLCT
jgi:hypothetical protein